jgi:ATP-dependent DNA ligase
MSLPLGFVPPCLPTKALQPPTGDAWLHEIKHDGYRLMVRREAAGIRLLTRNGHDWTDRFPFVRDDGHPHRRYISTPPAFEP